MERRIPRYYPRQGVHTEISNPRNGFDFPEANLATKTCAEKSRKTKLRNPEELFSKLDSLILITTTSKT